MKRALVAFLPLALWAAVVLVVGGLEEVRVPRLPEHADKVAHFLMYGTGGVLAAWAGWVRGWGAGWGALVFVILLGALDEYRQSMLLTRHGDLQDWAADVAGAIFFYTVTALILRRR